jgi:hypothetical protein
MGIGILITYLAISLIYMAYKADKPRETYGFGAVIVEGIFMVFVVLAVIYL